MIRWAIVFLFLSSTVYGQKENWQDKQSFSMFLHAGVNASQVGGDGLSGFKKLNLAAGIGVERFLSDKFDARIELNLLQKGSRKPADPNNGDRTSYKMSLFYAQVPILFEYKYNDQLSLLGGPGLGFLISDEETNADGVIPNTPEFNALDISVIISAKYLLSDRLGAEVRFDQSILPIRSNGSGSFQNFVSAQFNTVLGLFLSYSIN